MIYLVIAIFQVIVVVHPSLIHIFYIVTSHDAGRAEVHGVLLLVGECICQVFRRETIALHRLLVVPFLPLLHRNEW